MKNGALALFGTEEAGGAVLGGAVDGLNMVVPYREKNYYAMRPTIAIQPIEVLDVDGFFGLHPALGG